MGTAQQTVTDFFSQGWGWFVAIGTVVSILFCLLLIAVTARQRLPGNEKGIATTGHAWDEIEELNNPLPRWWVGLFLITIVFGLAYLYLFPGLSNHAGSLGWTQVSQYQKEMKRYDETMLPIFERYATMPIEQIASDKPAQGMGERMYLTYCVQCHGSDAKGSVGFPNLVDKDWLGVGSGEYIMTTILNGRQAVMPPMGAALGTPADVENVANYVLSLSGAAHDSLKAQMGKGKFGVCAACHGNDGKGNVQIGAPNLTDNIWLYGGGIKTIQQVIVEGKQNNMPSFGSLLGGDTELARAKARVLAAYVWSLSGTSAVASR